MQVRFNKNGCFSFTITQGIILAFILYFIFYLSIAEQISNFLVYKNKFTSDNCISIQMLMINNKRFQIIITKNRLLNNTTINALDNNKSFNIVTSIKRLRSCGSKHISENKNDKELLNPIISIKYLRSYENKCINKNNKDSNSKSKIATASFIAFTKYLA